jgi:hypothetical protein
VTALHLEQYPTNLIKVYPTLASYIVSSEYGIPVSMMKLGLNGIASILIKARSSGLENFFKTLSLKSLTEASLIM